ncbi:MAG: phosphatase PAP2 family protein [Eubacterium sp.]
MIKKDKRTITIMSICFYAIALAAMVAGTFYDLTIDKAMFTPDALIPRILEAFGQFVYWGIWGPVFSVLFVTRHDLNECLEIIGRLVPIIKPVKNNLSKAYKICNKALLVFEGIAFFALADIGWKKLIENVLKQFVEIPQIAYFIICAVVSAVSIFALSKIDKKVLNKLEAVALAGILLGFLYKMIEHCKTITGRIRFREMVAWSNGITQVDDGVKQSLGELDGMKSHLSKDMVEATDFGAFTPWYKIAPSYDYYDHPNSFPSGHTTYSCTALLSVILCKAYKRLNKYVPLAFAASFIYIAVMAVSRLMTGAHYLTDVAGAAIIGYTLFLIVNLIFDWLTGKDILPTRKQ